MRRFVPTVAAAVASVALFTTSSSAAPVRQPSVFGGTPVTAPVPFVVALVDMSAPSPAVGQFCGGVLVAPDRVVTAAHCLTDIPPDARVGVLAGRATLSGTAKDVIPVTGAIPHPRSGSGLGGPFNDIAILRLARPAAGPYASPIALGEEDLWRPGAAFSIFGWGLQNVDGVEPDALRTASVPVNSDADCGDAYGIAYEPDNMICAGDVVNGGIDTCEHDDGGPLAVLDGSGTWRLLGLVSWGFGCGEPHFPGVYTRIPTFRDWIASDPPLPPRPIGDRTDVVRGDGWTYVSTISGLGSASIEGLPVAGQEVQCKPGQWSGEQIVFTFGWLADGVSLDLESSDRLALTDEEVGKHIDCVVTGTNASGEASITASVGPVLATPPPADRLSPIVISLKASCRRGRCRATVLVRDRGKAGVAGVDLVARPLFRCSKGCSRWIKVRHPARRYVIKFGLRKGAWSIIVRPVDANNNAPKKGQRVEVQA